MGLALGAAVEAVTARAAVPRPTRAALAAAWAIVWCLAWLMATGRADWPAAFYGALLAVAAGGGGLAQTLPALAAGWGFWALATWALWPGATALAAAPSLDAQAGELAREPTPAVLEREPLHPVDGVELGRDARGRPGVLTDAEANAHVLVLGATGSGKTNALLLIAASALRRGLPLIVVDGKGSAALRARLQAAAASAGRPLRLWSARGPTVYDPLRHGGPSELRDKLMALETWTEPHYRRAAERHLGVVLATLGALGRQPSLAAVSELLPPARLEVYGRHLPDEGEARRLYAYLDDLDASARSAIAGLAHRLATLTESEAGPWLQPGASGASAGSGVLDLCAVVQQSEAALFSLDALRYPGLAAQAGALVLQDVKTVAADLLDAGWRRPWYLVIDEWGVFEGTHVLGLLTRGRESGLCCVLATQDLADVAVAGGPALVDQVLANTNVKLVLRQDAESSARRLAATLGSRPVWEPSLRLRRGAPTGEGSVRPAERPVLPPDLLLRLPPHQALFWRKAPDTRVQRLRLRRAEAEAAAAAPVGEAPGGSEPTVGDASAHG